jgi:flagellar biosynthetic protein FliO
MAVSADQLNTSTSDTLGVNATALSVADSSAAVLQSDQSNDTRSLAERTGVKASTPVSELSNPGNSMTAILRMLGALCAVLALMWVVVMVAKKYLRGKSPLAGAAKRMVVEETLWLGPKKQVVLLSVGSRHLVVGVTDETMTTLSEIASEELSSSATATQAAAKKMFPQGAESSNSFDRLLTQAGGRLQHLLKRTAPTS